MVWVWMGHAALADTALVPEFTFLDSADMPIVTGMTEMKADYRLSIDNLMDLTHEQFVHGSSIGHDSLSESDFEVTHSGNTVTVTKWMLGIEPPPSAGG
jgi:vanillate O-demethylase monooxygenase subunit